MVERPLPTPVRQLLREQEPETRLQPIWRGIAQRRARAVSAPNMAYAAVAAVASVVVVVFMVVVFWQRPKVEQSQRAHYPVVPTDLVTEAKPSVQTLGEASSVTLAHNTRLEVLRQTPTEMLMALRRGNAHFDILPGGNRAWIIQCGGASVEVIGTQFTLDRSELRLVVTVQRGRVLVRGDLVPDAAQTLAAGQELTIDYGETQRASPEVSALPQAVSAPARTTTGRVPSRQENVDWRSAAQQRDWKGAWQSLGESGFGRATSSAGDIADLLTLADVARLSGHPRQAVTPLQQVISRYSEDSRAAIAAFTLGKIELDQLGEPSAAAAAFERALSLKLPGSLAEDTLARLVRAYSSAHDVARARAAAERYRAQFPNGQRRQDVDRWSMAE